MEIENTTGYIGRAFVRLEDIEFIETPTTVVTDAVENWNLQQAARINEPDPSLVALSKIGNQVVGHEV